MKKILISVFFLFSFFNFTFSQVQSDLVESVPAWLEYDITTNEATLKWINDSGATGYNISEIDYQPLGLTASGTTDGMTNEFSLGTLTPGQSYGYHIKKNNATNSNGVGILTLGLEIPAIHERGRCMVAIDDTLTMPLQMEIERLMSDLEMDGWAVDTMHILRTKNVVEVKALISDWYDENYTNSQALFLLGRIAVPYSGNNAHDGHTNHQGAWSADTYYAELNGNWTDVSVNNTSPSREANKNIPGDGKYDQTSIPGLVELEVGRVDFYNLPAFTEDEIELTRNYLDKNHDFRIGNKDYPRRGMVENNFASFAEGFGQSGWRNFSTMFGGDQVSIGNYEVLLDTSKYLFSYACGGGSYTSMSGVGTTNNLWVAKDIQTVFTMNFGSYFGDWDSQNNFLRSALASGDVLTNAWSGRPIWQMYPMALGKHIGYCTMLSENSSGTIFDVGFSGKDTHMGLMGDPTLRLHAMKMADELTAEFLSGDIQLNWEDSPDAENGYFIYRKINGGNWELLSEFHPETNFVDPCIGENSSYEYMVKAIRLEHTGSGTYYNTSLGISVEIQVGENPELIVSFADLDMDGFGNADSDTLACEIPIGFVANDLDCDDTNILINPDAEEIPNNGIDEDCMNGDLMTSLVELDKIKIQIFPNPTNGLLFIESENLEKLSYQVFNAQGQLIRFGKMESSLDLLEVSNGLYWLEINDSKSGNSILKKVIVEK